MSKFAVITSISHANLLPPNPVKRLDRQHVALFPDDFDYVRFEAIPDAPAAARQIIGEGSEVGTNYGDPGDWQMNINGEGWSLNTRIGAAYYIHDLAAGIYED